MHFSKILDVFKAKANGFNDSIQFHHLFEEKEEKDFLSELKRKFQSMPNINILPQVDKQTTSIVKSTEYKRNNSDCAEFCLSP